MRRALSRIVALVSVALFLAGCASIDGRVPAPTLALAEQATVLEAPSLRAWADEPPKDVVAEIRRRLPHLPRLAQRAQRVGERPVVEILALSGGGTNGAFGAGVLAGWTARGDRPRFQIVTGVSAGALIAPFAFLGPRYDGQLRELWTQSQPEQIATPQILSALFGGSALADTSPLAKLIEQYIDARMLAAIAAEYRMGRLLLVGTTNLDAQRPVVWNMGEIAASRHPDAPHLFRSVLLASASIPGAFPPVRIKVRAAGRVFEELHVDGGTTREIFISPFEVPLTAFDALYPAPPIRRIYIVINGKMGPEYTPTDEKTIPIAMRAITTLTKAQTQSELYRLWRVAGDAGADFNMIALPSPFPGAPVGALDGEYQRAVYAEGVRLARSRTGWLKRPVP
jgi:hypothetical protein